MSEKLLSLFETSEVLKTCYRTAVRMVEEGIIKGTKVKTRYMVSEFDLDVYLKKSGLNNKFYTIHEVAEILKANCKTVRKMSEEGIINITKIGIREIIFEKEFLTYLENANIDTGERFYTVNETAKLIKHSYSTTLILIESGVIKSIKVGCLYKISESNLRFYLACEASKDKTYSLCEVAEILQISYGAARDLVLNEVIKSYKIGRRSKIHKEDLEAYLTQLSKEEKKYSITEIAKLLNVKYSIVHTLVRNGKIKSVKVGNKNKIIKSDLDTYVNREKLLSISEVAKLIKYSYPTTLKMVKLGTIESVKVGGRYLVRENDINNYIKK